MFRNGTLIVCLDPARFLPLADFHAQVAALLELGARDAAGRRRGGDPDSRRAGGAHGARAPRGRACTIDDETWRQIQAVARRGGRPMLEVVGMKEIDAIFAVTDALGIHREMLVIPLGPATPGRVRRLPSGKLEITVEAAAPIDEWLKELPALIAAAQK